MSDIDPNSFNDAPTAWDVSDVPDQMMLRDGAYDLEIISARYKKSEKTGRTYWSMRCRALGDDAEVKMADPCGFNIYEKMAADDQAKAFGFQRKVKAFLTACSLPPNFVPSEDGLKGLRFKGFVKQKPDQDGNPRAEVDRCYAPRP
jgi:hypothetical protein